MVYYTLYLSYANRQNTRFKVKILSEWKTDFSETGLALKGLRQF